MSVSVGPAFAGYDASHMVIVTSCETTITSIVHDVNDNHAKLGKDIASGVAANHPVPNEATGQRAAFLLVKT